MGSPGLSNRNNGQQQRLGITEPISLGGPTEYDVTKARELEKVLFLQLFRILLSFWAFTTSSIVLNLDLDVQYLQDAGLYENQQEAVSREEVLGRLDQVGFILFIRLRHFNRWWENQ